MSEARLRELQEDDDLFTTLTEEWHEGASSLSLQAYLGLTDEEYTRLVTQDFHEVRENYLTFMDYLVRNFEELPPQE